MGGKPSVAALAVATESASSGADTSAASVRFGMPHALVIIACIVTAAILAPADMGVDDVLLLLSGAGSIGAAIVVVVVNGGRRAGRIGRLVRAYFSAGN
ncbi:hypothetical protein [Streptomyces rishiriensis]|uniref:Uncharacterized protein n=1 Tax=Streptomyces rishiriensis TaxID=68264 RepID=A0ABU0NGT0_STRRH|nr:hypothetical protein [Streptomyces rishiriensis]MDQ0578313.1 hypothetical protein [Streptomyces rishiriensis]